MIYVKGHYFRVRYTLVELSCLRTAFPKVRTLCEHSASTGAVFEDREVHKNSVRCCKSIS